MDRENRKMLIADMIDAQYVALEKKQYRFVHDVEVTITGLALKQNGEKLPAYEEYLQRLLLAEGK